MTASKIYWQFHWQTGQKTSCEIRKQLRMSGLRLGGRGGIRTLGGFNTTAAFQATALNRYATRPESQRRREGKVIIVEHECLGAKQDFREAAHGLPIDRSPGLR